MRLYDYKNVKNIAFWRIGQEDSDVWDWIKIKDATANLEESEEITETK
jgi:spore germination protein YaaH